MTDKERMASQVKRRVVSEYEYMPTIDWWIGEYLLLHLFIATTMIITFGPRVFIGVFFTMYTQLE